MDCSGAQEEPEAYVPNWVHRASWIPIGPLREIRGPEGAQGKILKGLLGIIWPSRPYFRRTREPRKSLSREFLFGQGYEKALLVPWGLRVPILGLRWWWGGSATPTPPGDGASSAIARATG